MLSILTTIIGVIAKGPAAKARAGSLAGAILTGAQPVIDAFADGFAAGAIPPVEQLGAALGSLIVGGVVGYIITWVSPANAAK